MARFIYPFKDGNKDMKNILGGKGANLCEMSKIGLPVPPGFILGTKACMAFYKNKQILEKGMIEEIINGLNELENQTGKSFGGQKPLLLSIRSGAPVSMPGMMDTVLNLGMNTQTLKALVVTCGEDFAYDAYRRFIAMYGEVVLGIEKYKFDRIFERESASLSLVCDKYKDLVLKEMTKQKMMQKLVV